MTKHPIEVITSVERRRRWSREDKERLVAACLEPDAVISEVARAAGIHVSQLFRWRKELCRVERPRADVATTLVPVIVSEAAPTVLPVSAETSTTSYPKRKRSDVTIELGRDRRVRVDSDINTEVLGRILDVCWVGDDPGPERRESVVGDGPYRYAQRLPRLVADGTGDAETRPDVRSLVRIPWPWWRLDQGDLA